MVLEATLTYLVVMNILVVAGLAWSYEQRHEKRLKRLHHILLDPLSVRDVWTQGPDAEGYCRMFVEYPDGQQALLADHFEMEAANAHLFTVGIKVGHLDPVGRASLTPRAIAVA